MKSHPSSGWWQCTCCGSTYWASGELWSAYIDGFAVYCWSCQDEETPPVKAEARTEGES